MRGHTVLYTLERFVLGSETEFFPYKTYLGERHSFATYLMRRLQCDVIWNSGRRYREMEARKLMVSGGCRCP